MDKTTSTRPCLNVGSWFDETDIVSIFTYSAHLNFESGFFSSYCLSSNTLKKKLHFLSLESQIVLLPFPVWRKFLVNFSIR